MNNRIFLATPISGFSTEIEYKEYRTEALKLISFLRENGYEVCSELENVVGSSDYDSPAKSVSDDFTSIKANDYFLLLHPARMQTSSLIEFGYACAFDKKVVAVGRKKDMPYLVIGYEEFSKKAKIVETDKLVEDIFPEVLNALESLLFGDENSD